jgi:hypothetical protein
MGSGERLWLLIGHHEANRDAPPLSGSFACPPDILRSLDRRLEKRLAGSRPGESQ